MDKGKKPMEEGESSRRPYRRTARISRRDFVSIWLGGTRAVHEEPRLPPEPVAQPRAESQKETTSEEIPLLVEVNLQGTKEQVDGTSVEIICPPTESRSEEIPRPIESDAVRMGTPLAAQARVEEEEESEEDPEERPDSPVPDHIGENPVEDPQDLNLGVAHEDELIPELVSDDEPEEEAPQEIDQGEEDHMEEDLGVWPPWGEGDVGPEIGVVGWGNESPTSSITTVESS